MVCGETEGAFADTLIYQFGQWLVCDFPQWLNSLLSVATV
jgi:hypothetical protein